MRVLYKASLIFFLTDLYSRIPVRYASILCNGKQNPYTRKESGHYVFSNLYPGKYRIDIICKGFADVRLDLEVRANETKTIVMSLPYASDNDLVLKLKRFEISVNLDGVPLKNKAVRIKLKNNLNFLKVIAPIKANTNTVTLNMEKNSGLTLQKYSYVVNGTENEFYIYAYDSSISQYLTENPFKFDILPGGMLYPIWDLRTDDHGKVIFPVLQQFMKEEQIQFEIFAEGKYELLNTQMPGDDINNKAVYIDVDLVKPAPEPLPQVLPLPVEENPKAEKIEDKIDDIEDTEGEEAQAETTFEDAAAEAPQTETTFEDAAVEAPQAETTFEDATAEAPQAETTFEDAAEEAPQSETTLEDAAEAPQAETTFEDATAEAPQTETTFEDAAAETSQTNTIEKPEAEAIEDSIQEFKTE